MNYLTNSVFASLVFVSCKIYSSLHHLEQGLAIIFSKGSQMSVNVKLVEISSKAFSHESSYSVFASLVLSSCHVSSFILCAWMLMKPLTVCICEWVMLVIKLCSVTNPACIMSWSDCNRKLMWAQSYCCFFSDKHDITLKDSLACIHT